MMSCCNYLISSLLLVILSLNQLSESLKLPPYIKPCARYDPNLNDCATRHAKLAIPKIINGDRKYNIPRLDPLIIPELKVDQGADTQAVGFGFVARNATVKGPGNVLVDRIMFDHDLKHIEYHLTFLRLEVLSDYEVHGQILLLPITGKGFANITITEMKVRFKFNYTTELREDGKNYATPMKPDIDYRIAGRVYIDLKNLFNGNELLGQTMNNFLNSNWRVIAEEIGPVISEAFGELMVGILKGVFNLVSFEDTFPLKVSGD